jgi:periplasmic copper chaperone A
VRRIASVFGLAAVMVVALAAPAWAHVTISPSSAPKGSDAVLQFVVPNEQDTATTTRLLVQFPHDHPIADALIQPVAGWTAAVKMFHTTTAIQTDDGPVNDAVDTVTWNTNPGNSGIPVGDFQQFGVSVGLPGDADQLVFPAIQTYTCLPGKSCNASDLTVSWVQQIPPGGPEPDHPAPVLTLTAAEASSTATTVPSSGQGAATTSSNVKQSDVDTAKTVAIIAVVIGVLGLLVGLGGILLARRHNE